MIIFVIGRFAWARIGGRDVPIFFRIIDEKRQSFIPVRIAVSLLLNFDELSDKIYKCTSVNRYLITDAEATLLNDLNQNHAENMYGTPFLSGVNCMMTVKDLLEFLYFLDFCLHKLTGKPMPKGQHRCGYVVMNSESALPYCFKENRKYLPICVFEGDTDHLLNRAVKLEAWDVTYLKFCYEVQGIDHEQIAHDSCMAISDEDLRELSPAGTTFMDYWPSDVVDMTMATERSEKFVHVPNEWFRAPLPRSSAVATDENLPTNLPQPVVPQPPIIALAPNTPVLSNDPNANDSLQRFTNQMVR